MVSPFFRKGQTPKNLPQLKQAAASCNEISLCCRQRTGHAMRAQGRGSFFFLFSLILVFCRRNWRLWRFSKIEGLRRIEFMEADAMLELYSAFLSF
jgi:hypothetical protein